MDKILEVKNLKVSFRTSGGTVKAVRNISFDLERGKTLAIVGESGSGKSVTSKAILGILAGNSIIEGGEILFDGMDLLKIDEETMCDIRGNRISMIFQDPLSSLNPIVKIGRQITEAMLLKDKGNRSTARRDFNDLLAIIKENSTAALGKESEAKVTEMCKKFDEFNIESNHMQESYNNAKNVAEDLISDAEDFLFLASKNQKLDVKSDLKTMADKLKKVKDEFYTYGMDEKVDAAYLELKNAASTAKRGKISDIPEGVINAVKDVEDLMRTLNSQTEPDFFRIGFYKQNNPETDLHAMPVEELNEFCLDYLNENFMLEYLDMEQKGVEYSYRTALEKKKSVIDELKEDRTFFAQEGLSRTDALKKAKELAAMVEDSIDKLEINKDSVAYTFGHALEDAIDRYYNAVVKNPKEEARYAKQSAKRDALIAKGKTVDWKVVPKLVYDLDELKGNMTAVMDNMIVHYENYIAAGEPDFSKRSVEIVDFMKYKAAAVVHKITRSMAKEKAIELMEEVGIPEPRIRYNQYPFEFSGGMRQRIVIAIALAANPDILICDEPTTALDVTIQAQILELINKLKAERDLSVIFITHDLGVVANMADEIAVMYAGKIVEFGTADEIFYDPRHPYTWALLSSMPDLDTKEKLDAIPGTPPNMIYPPEGDAFAARNKYALQIDFEQEPPKFHVSDTHWAATWLLHPDAPKVEPPRIIVDRIERDPEVLYEQLRQQRSTSSRRESLSVL